MEAYLQDKVLLSTFCAALDDEPIVVLNEAALNTVVSSAGVFQEDLKSDFVVYIPENRYSEIDSYDIEFAAATTASTFFGLESYSFEAREYSHVDVVYFDLRNVSELTFGSDLISDPIVVYCNLSKARINELLMNNTAIDFGDRWTNIIFDINDTSFFSKSIKDRLADVQFRSVIELCNQYKSNLVRGVLLNSVLSAFLLVLNVMLISVIVKIEYLVHSKEIALKKILGYSVLQRNIAILFLNVLAVSIACITGTILSKMYGIFDIVALCIVSLTIIMLVFAIINAVWYFGYQQRYNAIAKNLEATYFDGDNDDDMLRYTKEVGDYTISLKMPEYLGSGGFVSIAKTSGYVVSLDGKENIIESSEMYITLYIWPKYFSDYKIGLDFYDEANSIWEQVELTSDMELMNTDDLDDAFVEYILQLISDYQNEINKLIDIAEENLDIEIAQS